MLEGTIDGAQTLDWGLRGHSLDWNVSLWSHWSCEFRQVTSPLCFPFLNSQVEVRVVPPIEGCAKYKLN